MLIDSARARDLLKYYKINRVADRIGVHPNTIYVFLNGKDLLYKNFETLSAYLTSIPKDETSMREKLSDLRMSLVAKDMGLAEWTLYRCVNEGIISKRSMRIIQKFLFQEIHKKSVPE